MDPKDSNTITPDERELTIRNLTQLLLLDIDILQSYEKAIGHISNETIRRRLHRFRDDHQRHIDEFTHEIHELGGRTPSRKIESESSLNSTTQANSGLHEALEALQTLRRNEAISSRLYADALSWDLREDLQTMIEQHREEERMHMSFIDNTIHEIEADIRRRLKILSEPPSAQI